MKTNCSKYHHFTPVYQKLQSYEVQFLRYGVTYNFCHFKPFFALFTVPEIYRVTDVIVTFYFGLFSALLTTYQPEKEFQKNEKKRREISSFYTSVPKIMIICYIVPGTWHVTHVIVTFHSGLFFVLLPS